MTRALVPLWLLAACAPPTFELDSEPARELRPVPRPLGVDRALIRALPVPRITVSQPRKSVNGRHDDEVSGWGQVAIHDHAATRGFLRLVIELEDGAPLSLEYALAGGWRLPVEVGDRLQVSYLPPVAREPARYGWVLELEGPHGQLLAALVVGQDRPAGLKSWGLPKQPIPWLRVRILDHGGYTEVRRSDTLCTSVIEHRAVDLVLGAGHESPAAKAGVGRRLVPSGALADFEHLGRGYRFVLFDASKTVLDEQCPAQEGDRFAYGVLALGPASQPTLNPPAATTDVAAPR
jgi:hypothetical protein